MRPPINGTILITQLFGGNPAMEAYTTANGYVVIGHTGIDIGCPLDTPVYPAWPGVVRIIRDSGGFGLHCIVTDTRGRSALYGHLNTVQAADGEHVKIHAPFALSGSSGNSTGPHLHFEIAPEVPDHLNGYDGAIDPLSSFDHDIQSRLDLHLTNL